MGLRVRLKASVDIARLAEAGAILAEAMKRYGIIVADNGSGWYMSRRARPALDQRPSYTR